MTTPSVKSQTVKCPPSRHITTSFEALVLDVVERTAAGEKEVYEEVAKLLDASPLFDFQRVRRQLKQNFKPFSDAAAGKRLRLGTHNDLDGVEAAFLEGFFALLQAAHFKVLTASEWESACENDFTFTQPVEVTWSHMDPSLLRQFWARRQKEEVPAPAPISDRALILHRGVHLARAKGMFLEDKIDFLVLYLIARPLQRLLQPLLHAIFKDKAARIWPTVAITQTVKDAGVAESLAGRPEKTQPPVQVTTSDPSLQHDNAKSVERITLKDHMPNTAAVFRSLFKEITIQEPTFRDVVILYRRDAKSQIHAAKDAVLLKDAKPEDMERNLNIKRFQDIPMADIEMIFPDKKVFLKPLLVIQLIVTIIVGLISVIVTILTTEANWSLLMGVLSIIGTRAFQVWSSAQLGRQRVLDQITERLYEQTMDAQEGVLYFLLDQMADQHVKELLLAYVYLLRAGEPLTQHQLDRLCEKNLKQVFGEAVDFALENSLPVLIEYGLVKQDAQGRLVAAPAAEARQLLLERGRAHYSGSATGPQYKLPLLQELTSFAV